MSMYCFPDGKYGEALEAIYNEVRRAKDKHGPKDFNSNHEGFAVLKEEVDELWAEVMKDDTASAVEEAVQVAAMAVRFVAERGTYPFKKVIKVDFEKFKQDLLNNNTGYVTVTDLIKVISAKNKTELENILQKIINRTNA